MGRSLWWGLAALAVGVAGCADAVDPAAGGPSTVSTSPEHTSGYSAHAPAVVAVENPDGMAVAAGALWVKTDDGRVVRIDPATNRVTGQVKLDTTSDPNQYCQGIGSHGASLWACATTDQGTDVVQLDAATRHVLRRVAAHKVFDQLTIPVTSRGAWVLTGDGTTVAVVSLTGQVTSYPLGVRCLQLAASEDKVVATSSTEGAVVALDAYTGQVTARTSLPAPRLAAITPTAIWIDTSDGLTRLSSDLTPEAKYPSLAAAGAASSRLGAPYLVGIPTAGVVDQLDSISQLAGGDGQALAGGEVVQSVSLVPRPELSFAEAGAVVLPHRPTVAAGRLHAHPGFVVLERVLGIAVRVTPLERRVPVLIGGGGLAGELDELRLNHPASARNGRAFVAVLVDQRDRVDGPGGTRRCGEQTGGRTEDEQSGDPAPNSHVMTSPRGFVGTQRTGGRHRAATDRPISAACCDRSNEDRRLKRCGRGAAPPATRPAASFPV